MKSKQIDMVSDIVKLCDDYRNLIPSKVMMSNTEIMLELLESAVTDALGKNEGLCE